MGVPVPHLALSPQRALHGASVKQHQSLILTPAGVSRAGVCPFGIFAALQGEMLEMLALRGAWASSRDGTGCLHQPQTLRAFLSSSSELQLAPVQRGGEPEVKYFG